MKRFILILPCLGWWLTTAVSAAPAAPDLIAQIHFAGAGQVAADTNAVAFTNLWCSPEAVALRRQTLDKLARAPYAWFKTKIAPGAGDEAARLRPLLDDLLSAEWFFQVRATGGATPELALAIRLDAARAQLWQSNLKAALEAWTAMSVQKTRTGWELKKHLPPNLVRFARVGDWVVVGCGQDDLPLNAELVRRIQAGRRPGPPENNAWLTADLDWPRLARCYAWMSAVDLPEIRLQAGARDRNLHLEGKLIFAQPLALNLEPWRIPTNTIHQPFISFTAARGIAPWLEQQRWAQPYDLSPTPNQVFIWALAGMPLQAFVAVPVANAEKSLAELAQKMSAHTNWQGGFMVPLKLEATRNRLAWTGLPFIAPAVDALHEPNGDFLFANAFPNTPRGKPLPPELMTLLEQSNLVYYHWEITAERLRLLPQLSQLALLVTEHQQLDAHSAAGKWLARIGPTLGTSAMEITRTAPNELSFVRKAPAGLTAVELTALASWLEATNFPGCDLRLPPRKLMRPHQTHLTSPAPPSNPAPTLKH